jgi:hypothetical protein
LRQQ